MAAVAAAAAAGVVAVAVVAVALDAGVPMVCGDSTFVVGCRRPAAAAVDGDVPGVSGGGEGVAESDEPPAAIIAIDALNASCEPPAMVAAEMARRRMGGRPIGR